MAEQVHLMSKHQWALSGRIFQQSWVGVTGIASLATIALTRPLPLVVAIRMVLQEGIANPIPTSQIRVGLTASQGQGRRNPEGVVPD